MNTAIPEKVNDSPEEHDHILNLAGNAHWIGNEGLLARPLAAILNSRQSKHPGGNEAWVRSTVAAVGWACRNEYSILAAVGMKTWELALWASGETLGGMVVLVGVPRQASAAEIRNRLEQVRHDFRLVRASNLLVPYYEHSGRAGAKAEWLARDRWILKHARLLLPVSIRPGGFLARQLELAEIHAKTDNRFLVTYNPQRFSFPPPPDSATVNKALSGIEWDYLTHWTRISNGPWPGERASDFYRDLVAGNGYPRSAFATLTRILRERRIRATSWRMPGAHPMVSFTSLHPAEMVGRMKWRQRYVRPSFEPYGIAIGRGILEKTGIREVSYGSPAERKKLTTAERLFFQSVSAKQPEWPLEREWRLGGDLELDGLQDDDMLILVPSLEEREILSSLFPWRVVAIEKKTPLFYS